MKFMTLCACILLFCTATNVEGQQISAAPKSWAGTWRGPLTNLPAHAGATLVEVTMEIGPFPAADKACSMWRSTYAESGVVKQVKDYRFCRGVGADDLFIDEGDGTKLTAFWMGEVLVSPFKYDDILLVSSMRLRGEVLEHEILSVDDKPAIKGVQPLRPRSIQRIELRRIPAGL